MGNGAQGEETLCDSHAEGRLMGRILITGAGKRVGRQLALDLAADGHDIAVHYNASRAEAEDVAGLIRAMGRKAAVLPGNLADAGIGDDLVARAQAALGSLDVLINNASIYEVDELGSVTPESWERHLNINLRAPVMLAQAFARALPAGQHGNIINIIDERVWKLNPQFFSYTISKSALWTATQTMAQALAPRIRVNAIGPGPALPSSRQSPADFAKQESLTLLERGTSPSEIARAAKFILSMPSMTGQMIALDGGQHLLWRTVDVVEVKE
jgi:NAD(P)-dependent dehydrogenase (short-subunit alcohol dehydrogenase family)